MVKSKEFADLRKMKRKMKSEGHDGPVKRKDLKKQRQKQKDEKVFNTSMELKKIWEHLRTLDNRSEIGQQTAKEVLDSLINSATKEGEDEVNLSELFEQYSRKHDTSRVLQAMLTKGDPDLRLKICNSMIEKVPELMTVKYANFVVQKMLACIGTKKDREEFYGKVIDFLLKKKGNKLGKLMRDSYAGQVVETLFHSTTPDQQNKMLASFYGKDYTVKCERHLGGDAKLYSLSNLLDKLKEDEAFEILVSLSKLFETFLDRECLQMHSLIHCGLYHFVQELGKRKNVERVNGLLGETIELLRDVIPFISHSSYGSKLSNLLIWHGSAKDRKHILKAVSKEDNVIGMTRSKYGSQVIVCLLDCVDDTRNLNQSVTEKIFPVFENMALEKTAEDVHAKKVFLYIVKGRESLHKDSIRLTSCQDGDDISTSKKDAAVRHKEIFKCFAEKLIKILNQDFIVTKFLKNENKNLGILFISDTIRYMINNGLSSDYEKFILEQLSLLANFIEKKGVSFSFRFLTKNLDNELFNNWVENSLISKVSEWLTSNRGCFGLVQALEASKSQKLVDVINKKIQKSKPDASKGLEILEKRISELEAETQ